MALKVDDTFFSFAEFSDKLKLFQKETLTQFTIIKSEKLPETDVLYDAFKYSVLRYGCKQGQLGRQPTGGGKRPKQRSYKVNCPVQMNVRLNRPKGRDPFLKVTKLEISHENHQVSQEMFQLYPEQRHFAIDEADKLILSSKTMKTSERRELLENRHGVAVMSQDIYNKQRKMAGESGQPDTDEDRCQEIGETIVAEGGFVEVGRDETGGFAFFAYITQAMLCLLSKFPECLIMDCTYKVNHYLLPLLTIMIVDGEGHGMPVFHAFLAREDKSLIERCLLFFSKHIVPSRISCFIVDKDMSEIAAITSVFPNVPVNLCAFHIFQAVERHLRKELGRSASCVQLVLDLFMKQVSTESDTEFGELRLNISSIVPQPIVEYFESHWWNKRHMWAACCNVEVMKFTQTTTNTLESYHSKIKKHISEKLSLSNCLSALLCFDHDKIINARRQQVISFNCNIYNHKDTDETEVSISSNLTRFAADIARHELSVFKKIVYDIRSSDNLNTGTYIVQFKDRSQTTSLSSCTCSTFGHLKLPCRHIFAVRQFMSVCLFDVSIIPNRFLLAGIDATNLPEDVPDIHYSVISLTSSTKTVEGRYRKAKSVCERMMNVMSVMGEREFTEKLNQLQYLLDSWTGGEGSSDVGVVEVAEGVVVPAHEPEVGEGVIVSTQEPEVGEGVVPARVPEVGEGVVPARVPEVGEGVIASAQEPEVGEGVVSAREPEVGEGVVSACGPEVGEGVVSARGPEVGEGVVSACGPEVGEGVVSAHWSEVGEGVVSARGSEVGEGVVSARGSEVGEGVVSACGPEVGEGVVSACGPEFEAGEGVISVQEPEMSSVVVDAHQPSWPRMSKIKPRGRPSTKQTFTKLSRKRYRCMPLTFQQLTVQQQCQMLVSAVANFSSLPADAITSSYLKMPCLFNDIVMDDAVDVSIIKNYFDASAWSLVEEGIASRRDGGIFTCGHCKEVDDGAIKMIQCERCLVWFHFNCVNYTSKKRVVTWFCEACM